MATVVEKASTSLGVIIFKCLAVNPDVEDYDEDVADAESVEKAFYEFMANQPDEPVDINHKEKVAGRIVAGWYFPNENVFRVAFKPDDPEIVQKAKDGEYEGSSFAAIVHREPLYG